ncbi:MAG: hypothetical protein ABIR47_08850 [Candidatus Kapaibacterium sp.]
MTMGCSHSKSAERERERYERRGEHEGGEEEEEENARPVPPPPWGGGIVVAPLEGGSDTVSFHIGSPMFLRMHLTADRACTPFNGTPFYFDAAGAQLGWGFEEVADSLLFPRTPGSCDRMLMLSSENSNRIAEGVYTFKVLIFIDAESRLYSDTIVVRAVRSNQGADTLSYARFLQEQIARRSPMLNDPETIRALFADGTPKSAESEIYRGVILYRGGDYAGAGAALRSSKEIEQKRRNPLTRGAAAARDALALLIAGLGR